MTVQVQRIRWEPNSRGTGFLGYAGTMDTWLFQIWAPCEPDDEWVLAATVQGLDRRARYAADLEDLKPEAEAIFAQFVASLGAVFPEG